MATASPHLENVVEPLPEVLVTVSPSGSVGPVAENFRTLLVAGDVPLALVDQLSRYAFLFMKVVVDDVVPLVTGNIVSNAAVVKFALKLLYGVVPAFIETDLLPTIFS